MEKLAELFTGSDSEQNTAVIACTHAYTHSHTAFILYNFFTRPPSFQQQLKHDSANKKDRDR